jgi:Na+/H+ antiporter NhaD/arsenite permease-like protein
MLLYPAAVIFATAILFAGIPATINEANRVHIADGREPNAGVAFAPDLIVMTALWCLGTWLTDHFLGRSVAWIGLASTSTLLLLLAISRSRKSSRDYRRFMEDSGVNADLDGKNTNAQQAGASDGDKPPI